MKTKDSFINSFNNQFYVLLKKIRLTMYEYQATNLLVIQNLQNLKTRYGFYIELFLIFVLCMLC